MIDNSKFYNAQDRWLLNHNKKDWDLMFIEVLNCCISSAKKKAKGIIIPELEEKATDAAIKVMGKYKDPTFKIGKLENVCYFPVIEQLYAEQTQFNERTLSFEDFQNDKGEDTYLSYLNNSGIFRAN